MPEKVAIFDTTLRDGEQSAGAGLTVDEKVRIAHRLAKLGVDVIEAGFAASSASDMRAIQTIGREVENSTVCSLARAVETDIDAAAKALKNAHRPRIHTFISSSDIHIKNQMRIDREATLEMAVRAVKHARRYCDDIEFSPMDASRTDHDFLFALLEQVIEAGATTVNIPDTVGYALPSQFGALIKSIRNQIPNIDKAVISVHCHNDLGMAVANSIAAVENGARQVEGCINGLGERAGNAAIEEVVMVIETRRRHFNLATNINLREIGPTSNMVAGIYGFAVQHNKAVVGKNAFRHSSGIHQDGYLKHRANFEIMDPEQVGWRGESLVLGKLSGRAGLGERLRDLGYHLDSKELGELFADFKSLADTKHEVTDRDLLTLLAARHRLRDSSATYKLVSVRVTTGSGVTPDATVELKTADGKTRRSQTEGTGPVDAIFKAIDKLVAEKVELLDYSVSAVTKGIDALGEATTRVAKNGAVYGGRGSNIDILVASAEAYLNAINRALSLSSATAPKQAYSKH